jgi:hypothetical protein
MPLPEIISRRQALDRGLIRYFTGKPCKRGHLVERLTSSANCLECHRLAEQTPARKAANILYQRRLRAAAVAGNAGV